MKTFAPVALVVFALSGFGLPSAKAQQPDQIQTAIEHCADHLRQSAERAQSREIGLMAYSLLKAGEPADSAAIQKMVGRILEEKFPGGHYLTDSTNQFYEAGCDLMALCESDPKKYARQIDDIANFIIAHQNANGSWYYWARHDQPAETEGGDTSVTQYAVLGLWAAARTGAKIPRSVWGQLASWALESQCPDGGFAYHPGRAQDSTLSMTVNGISALCIARLFLFPKGDYTVTVEEGAGAADEAEAPANRRSGKAHSGVRKSADSSRGSRQVRPDSTPEAPVATAQTTKFGVLKTLDLDAKKSTPASGTRRIRESKGGAGAGVSLARLNKGIGRGLTWLQDHYKINSAGAFPIYYLYGLERACALSGMKDFNGHDWYLEGSANLIQRQSKGGAIGGGMGGENVGTSFAILFLSRATSKIIHAKPGERQYGGGLMIGGRGLPTNLGSIQAGADGIQAKKIDAPVDQLLSELENPKSANVEAAQQAIVERVELGDREALIGNRKRLMRLARDPRPEVRRTAIWALGRCATIHEAHVLVKALDDPDLGVVVEANNALCWFSRRPNAFGRRADPFADLPENATDRRKEDAAKSWRQKVRTDWRTWFENTRPYAERNLPIDLP